MSKKKYFKMPIELYMLRGNSSCSKIENSFYFLIELNDHTGLQQKPSDKFFIHKNSCFNLAPIYP